MSISKIASRVGGVSFRSPPAENFNARGVALAVSANGPGVCTFQHSIKCFHVEGRPCVVCPCPSVLTKSLAEFRCAFPRLALRLASMRAAA